MNKFDLFLMAFRNLWRRKLRTFLTVLGVVIGTTSIVTMLSLGLGVKDTNRRMIESMGDVTVITVTPAGVNANPFGYSSAEEHQREKNKKKTIINDSTISQLKQINGVVAATPIKEMNMTIYYRRYQAWGQVIGIDPAAMEAMGYKVSEGRPLKTGDKMTAVFGGQVGSQFSDPRARGYRPVKTDPLKDKYVLSYNMEIDGKPIKKFPFKVVGILPENNYETAWSIIMPIKDVEEFEKQMPKEVDSGGRGQQKPAKGTYKQAKVKVSDVKYVESVQQAIKDMGHNTYSLLDQAKEFEQGTNVFQAILGGIGGISLLVAAIGITNTMIMSIYERTREIGVMKVIGAAIADIKLLFLVEASLIGLTGGAVGSILSLMISKLLNYLFQNSGMASPEEVVKISIVPLWLVMAALVFSALIGLVSGYLPARRAMKLSALEAIRTE